jgi:hypothetical protein
MASDSTCPICRLSLLPHHLAGVDLEAPASRSSSSTDEDVRQGHIMNLLIMS